LRSFEVMSDKFTFDTMCTEEINSPQKGNNNNNNSNNNNTFSVAINNNF